MIPSVLAHQLKKGVEDFLQTTFPVSTPFFHGIMDRLLNGNSETGIFKGPYLSIHLPFKTGNGKDEFFPEIPMDFTPYLHQEKAFQRLSGEHTQSTLIATGTGSGKTESFLYPVLDYCRRHSGEPGIKALFIYPMNALASDQALRIAKLIYGNDKLKNQITAGLFVGQSEKEPHYHMGKDYIITNKDEIRSNPPDILLTNYKMLDYLLIRVEDFPLWRNNGPETMKYLVVDEFHTFDGAQGTDLACLIRRVKARLKIPEHYLCCVGTSATLGSDEEMGNLQKYACEVFGEAFNEDSIVPEYRQSAGEFLENSFILKSDIVQEDELERLNPYLYEKPEEYIIAQIELWFGYRVDFDCTINLDHAVDLDCRVEKDNFHTHAGAGRSHGNCAWQVKLAEDLKNHSFFQNIIKLMKGRLLSYDDIFYELDKYYPDLRDAGERYKHYLLISLISLISTARLKLSEASDKSTQTLEASGKHAQILGASDNPTQNFEASHNPKNEIELTEPNAPSPLMERGSGGEVDGEVISEKLIPFLHVRVQSWLRELRRMVGKVSKTPEISFSDDLNDNKPDKYLPLIHCRECNCMGWGGVQRKADTKVHSDLQTFYAGFFSNDSKVKFLFPEPESENTTKVNNPGYYHRICGSCLNLTENLRRSDCPSCGDDKLIRVFIPDKTSKKNHDCPYCGGKNSLTIIGSRAASLTSVLIAQLFSSGFNDDKKLITFSDSVQDAAHRAGFFSSRTYRFNFRSALQQFVMAKCQCNDEPLSPDSDPDEQLPMGNGAAEKLILGNAADEFVTYWSQRMEQPEFIATFLAPDMAWFNEYEKMKETGKVEDGSDLPELVKKRIGWEIVSEYGFRSRFGRTLEKTGSSLITPDPDLFETVSEALLESVGNEIGHLRNMEMLTLKRLVLGFLMHLKNRGAVIHEGLGSYISGMGDVYIFNKIPYMPRFGKNARTPAFLTTKKNSRFDAVVTGKQSRRTWYESWAAKCLDPIYPLVNHLIGDVYDIIIKNLMTHKLLEERSAKGERVWGILPDAYVITDDVAVFRCDKCGHEISAVKTDAAVWKNAECQRVVCVGRYTQTDYKDDYYAALYKSGDIKRIFAFEHTGLLDRDERQKLEERFKAKPAGLVGHLKPADGVGALKPWDPNLLSCTPTLEMGIDIGDLSSLILCSVPPAQANYLQRIGRAGRKDGNSINFTIAAGKPHDLYFFEDPYLMMAGHVEPPGVYLNAAAVLERQLTAFCFDRWVESGINEKSLPQRLRQIFPKLGKNDTSSFPYNLIHFIELYQTVLLDDFLSMFKDALTEASKKLLVVFMNGNTDTKGCLGWKIVDGLNFLKKDRDNLKKKINALTQKIKNMEKEKAKDLNYDLDLAELKKEKVSFQKFVTQINDRHVLNYFTDEGLLPNYSFPEAGVTLRSIIFRRKTRVAEGESNYDTFTYDYERSAISAISELAPENSFYADGRKVKIDQINVDLSEVQTWRFCKNCSHMVLSETVLSDTQHTSKMCPRCGDAMWLDAQQKRQMLRMRQVIATTSDKDSRISDDADDREPLFYNKQMLVGCHKKDITGAYIIQSNALPFGFEFLAKADFHEINFGEKGEDGEKVTINGNELVRKGFVICKHCGKVKPKKGEFKHALSCGARWKDSDKNFTECVYLYRDFSSEAIRILLPVTTFEGSDKKLHSFIAAIHLGLKKRFGGSVNHLQTALQEAPDLNSKHRKKYLIIYDTVPGGTGYLKQIMRSEKPLMMVFERALHVLRSCSCHSDPEKDGCYRCLYAYRRSYNMAGTSRDCAIELLSDILKHKENIVPTESLENVEMNALFDSELEARFIEMLRRSGSGGSNINGGGGDAGSAESGGGTGKQRAVKISKQNVNGKPGYFFKIGNQVYNIELQVDLGKNWGASVPSKADFVFWPARSAEMLKPIVVFTDGFAYHKDRIGKDMAQRCALIASDKFHVFSLSWNDVVHAHDKTSDFYENYLAVKDKNRKMFDTMMEKYRIPNLKNLHEQKSFEWLIRILEKPQVNNWAMCAFTHVFFHLNKKSLKDSEYIEAWKDLVSRNLPGDISDELLDFQGNRILGSFFPDNGRFLKFFISADMETVGHNRPDGFKIVCVFNEMTEHVDPVEFEFAWNGFLRLLNLLQFLDEIFFMAKDKRFEGFDIKIIKKCKDLKSDGSNRSSRSDGFDKSDDREDEKEWLELKELSDEAFHGLIDQFSEHHFILPEAGYELEGKNGEIIGEAEFAWPEMKIAIFSEDQEQYMNLFQNDQWECLNVSIIINDFDALKNLFA